MSDPELDELRGKLQDMEEHQHKLDHLSHLAEIGYAYAVADLTEQLISAQATIAKMREALESCTPADYTTSHVIHPSFDDALVEQALAIPVNLDQLHEARALEIEKLIVRVRPTPGIIATPVQRSELVEFLTEEAAAHRAKKGEGK